MRQFLLELSVAQYWALIMAIAAGIFAVRRGLCAELRTRHWLRDSTNRLSLGIIVVGIGGLINASTWGSAVTAQFWGLDTHAVAVQVATAVRPLVRFAQILGWLLVISALTDSRREWLDAVGVVTLVFVATWILAVVT